MTVLDGQGGGPILTATTTQLVLQWLTFTGGHAQNGGGLRVPESFPTIRAALLAIPLKGVIDIGPGTWQEALVVRNQDVELFGREGAMPDGAVRGR